MSAPVFFVENILPQQNVIALDEVTSKHIVQVLRMQPGKELQLTDGKGNLLSAEIEESRPGHGLGRS